MDFVAYVAKDSANRRACHVIECGGGIASEVIITIGTCIPALPSSSAARNIYDNLYWQEVLQLGTHMSVHHVSGTISLGHINHDAIPCKLLLVGCYNAHAGSPRLHAVIYQSQMQCSRSVMLRISDAADQ